MFSDFFYFMRGKGFDVSLSEWLTLMNALDQGLCNSSFTEFYYVARMILVKSEADYDKFDGIFEEYFKGIKMDEEDDIDKFLKWLDKPDFAELQKELARYELEGEALRIDLDKEEVLKKYHERLKEQNEEHNGANLKTTL